MRQQYLYILVNKTSKMKRHGTVKIPNLVKCVLGTRIIYNSMSKVNLSTDDNERMPNVHGKY